MSWLNTTVLTVLAAKPDPLGSRREPIIANYLPSAHKHVHTQIKLHFNLKKSLPSSGGTRL